MYFASSLLYKVLYLLFKKLFYIDLDSTGRYFFDGF